MNSEASLPLITIGICCFNAEETIGRAIESALAQVWPNFEIVIVDDASTDGSVAVIEEWISGEDNARLIKSEKNNGAAESRNIILRNAKGDFVVFFDDDDKSESERIATQYNKIIYYEIEADTDLIACYASGVREYPSGYKMAMDAIGSRPVVPQGPEVADYLLFYGRKPERFYGAGTPTCALMARRTVFEAIGGFDARLRRAEDVDFAIRLALAGGHFIGCNESLFVQYATTAADKSAKKNLQAELILAEKHKKYLQSRNRYDYAKIWPTLRYYHFMRDYKKMAETFLKLFLKYPLDATLHILRTGPRRLLHELNIKI